MHNIHLCIYIPWDITAIISTKTGRVRGQLAQKGFTRCAARGNVTFMRMLAQIQIHDWLHGTDNQQIAYWMAQAAEAGDIPAQLQLMSFYGLGSFGFEIDTGKVAYWCQRALPGLQRRAERGLPDDQINLGALCEYGVLMGCPIQQTLAKANQIYFKAIICQQQLAVFRKRPDIQLSLMFFCNGKGMRVFQRQKSLHRNSYVGRRPNRATNATNTAD